MLERNSAPSVGPQVCVPNKQYSSLATILVITIPSGLDVFGHCTFEPTPLFLIDTLGCALDYLWTQMLLLWSGEQGAIGRSCRDPGEEPNANNPFQARFLRPEVKTAR